MASEIPALTKKADRSQVHSLDTFPSEKGFETVKVFPALRIPAKRTADLRKMLKSLVLQRPRTPSVYGDDDPNFRILVLRAGSDDPILRQLLSEDEITKINYSITFGYVDMTVDQVLRRILPASEKHDEVPSAFELVGSLAHVNLRNELLPYKYWIGKVILDKNRPTVKTVVNKIGTIETEYRTFGMEVIAGYNGEGWSQVTVKEEGCVFELDFREVYWNSRLAGEHRRLVKLIRNDAQHRTSVVVADLMAGIGPFSVPLTSSKNASNITVYANDLNPASYKYLKINATTNKCRNLHCFNQDARAFVHYLQHERIAMDHVIMNLPASAPDFLDAFRSFQGERLPRIHVHCFAPKESEASEYPEAVARCEAALGSALDRETIEIRTVRNVAPNKNMVCLSFVLPEGVMNTPPADARTTVCNVPTGPSDCNERGNKRVKTT